MRILLYSTILAVVISFGFSQTSFAGCSEGPPNNFTCTDAQPNPDIVGIQEDTNNNNITVDMQPGSIINTTVAGTVAISLGDGNNQVTLNNAQSISLEDDGIEFGNGNHIVNINNSEVRCADDCVDMRDGNDMVNVSGSIIDSLDNNGIDLGGGNDVATVTDSQVIAGELCCDNFGITLGDGDDTLTVINSRVAGFTMFDQLPRAITITGGNNTVRLGTQAQIDGLIDCNLGDGFDTIVFEMAVPTDQVAAITAEINSKNPAGDSIVINGLLYQWEDCEELVAELEGGFSFPVPTLSEWGLIAMAALLGTVGFMVIRRRQITA